ncbi:protein translocase subunit SecD [uncultured Rothia sp.]|uniref:protein translocase subunit SecD n=1 Tax=uncultured Rothia sp. TaxID=316088 RepID=UPI0025DD749A|nr:protein translocase subunit SecD [uncultured Rothia sp.]
MAKRSPLAAARGALLSMVLLMVVMVAGIFGSTYSGGSWAPKLALDLSGGTQMILSPKVNGSSEGNVSQEQLNQAVEIIRQRVDGAGVSEAEVTTSFGSGNNVVVSVPGTISSETRQLIQASANMTFRPVLVAGEGAAIAQESRTADDKLPKPSADPTDGSDRNWITADLYKQYEAKDCTAARNEDADSADPTKPMVACSADGKEKYILGPVELSGSDISTASHSQETSGQGVTTGRWAVNIQFNDAAREKFQNITSRLNAIRAQNSSDARARFAILLDGKVLSAPVSQAVISDGKPQITGNFTEQQAKALADQLKYGALPISFTIQSEQQISATLGSEQLRVGLLTGLIGLLLVFVYSLFQYRLLGFVTIASLVVAGIISYEAIALLGWALNYRLSLAGVAGLIVAIGATADSFIVYFERIRDEIRAGRTIPSAVNHGWKRASRTILASKAVNLLAAVVLYVVSVGSVKGFAFTLGLTAIADLLVVYLFTHPALTLLANTRYFGEGHRHSGLSPESLGSTPLYRGAGRIRTPEEKQLSIAERRRAERAAEESASDGAASASDEKKES